MEILIVPGETRTWIFIAIYAVLLLVGWGGIILYFRRTRRRMSDYIFYHHTIEKVSKRVMSIYPQKLTEDQRKELSAIEARLLELAENASEDLAINLKETK